MLTVLTNFWIRVMRDKFKDEVKHLRNISWINACLAVTGCTSFGCLYAKTTVVNEGEWSRYKSGYRDFGNEKKRVYSPSPETVDKVGYELPGTAQVWHVGPASLPLWSVLDGDLATCEKVLTECLHSHKSSSWMLLSKKLVKNMTLKEKCQALLEVSIPSSWFEKPAQSDEHLEPFWWADEDNPIKPVDLRFADTSKMFYTLFELLELEKNILVRAYSKSNKNKSVMLGKTVIKNFGEFKVARPENLVGFLAAAILCVVNSKIDGDGQLADIAFFFFEGISEGISNEFGTEVLNYINEVWNL